MEPFGFKSARLSLSPPNEETRRFSRGGSGLDIRIRSKTSLGGRGSKMGMGGGSSESIHHDARNYDPEKDLANAHLNAQQRKRVSFFGMFRYATWFDIFLMFIGASVAILGGVLVVLIILWCSHMFLVVLFNVVCCKDNTHGICNVKTLKNDVVYFLQYLGFGALALFASHYISLRTFGWAADRQMKKIAKEYFEWVVRKDLAWFEIYVDRGHTNLINDELTRIRFGIGEIVPLFLNQISTNVCVLGFAFASNYKLTLYLLVASLLFVVPMYLSSYAEYRQAFVGVQYLGRVIRLAEATFCNIEILKTYQNEGYIVERFGKFHNYYLSHSRKWVIVASCCNGIVWTLFYLTVLGVIAIGRSISEFGKDFLCRTKDVSFQNWAKLDLTHGPLNEKGPQSFIIILLCVSYVSSHVLDMVYAVNAVLEAKARAAEAYFLIDWKPRIDNLSPTGRIPKASAVGRIELTNISFKYPRSPQEYVLRNLHLVIYPAQIIGIVGSENSGKSSLMKMIMRFYDPVEGEIFVDGVDLRDYNLSWLRSQIYYLTHDTVVFQASVLDNLQLNNSFPINEVHSACKLIGIHDKIVDLPHGYDTKLSGRFHNEIFTEVELRKLALARALVLRPKVFIIDEERIIEDNVFEEMIVNVVNRLRKNCTIIFSAGKAHDLMRHCDYIYFFENGRVTDHGTHLELLQAKGAYYDLFEDAFETDKRSKTEIIRSQLASYKLAKSLRAKNAHQRSHLENLPSVRSKRRSEDEMLFLMTRNNQQVRKQNYEGFGFGGFQRYSFAKSLHSSSGMFERFKSLRPTESAAASKRKASIRSSFGEKEETETPPPVAVPARRNSRVSFSDAVEVKQDERDRSRHLLKKSIKPSVADLQGLADFRSRMEESGGIRASTMLEDLPNATLTKQSFDSGDADFDDISITSEDSEEFWDNYVETIEHARLSRFDGTLLGVMNICLNGDNLMWISLGGLASIILGMLLPISDIFLSWVSISFLPEATFGRALHGGWWYAILYLLLAVVAGISAFAQEFCFSMAGKKICSRLRNAMFAAMVRAELKFFEEAENDVTFLCERLARDVDTLQHVFLTFLGVTLQYVAGIVTAIIAVLIMFDGWRRALIAVTCMVSLAVVACGYFGGVLFYRQIDSMDAQLQNSGEISNQFIGKSKTCIGLHLESFYLNRFKAELKGPFRRFYLRSELRCIMLSLAKSLPWAILAMFVYCSYRLAPVGQVPDTEYLIVVSVTVILRFRNYGEVLSFKPSFSLAKKVSFRINKIINAQPSTGKETSVSIDAQLDNVTLEGSIRNS